MAIVLKYTAAVYEAKISTFESLDAQLNQHLATLEALRDRVSQFWQGEQTAQYVAAIRKAIVKVQKASADIKKLSREYTEIINEQKRVGGVVDDIVGAVDKATDKAIDAAGVVADAVGAATKVIPLL